MTERLEHKFFLFLEKELMLSREAVLVALQHHHADIRLLPITLWKHELVTIDKVSAMFDWLADVATEPATDFAPP
ncbi:hypothetical protein S7335_4367 [Synechococcus sp. PCC 7335]|uniref:DUF2949 domain-containing protein n=1 Tax=Synechococcus sp. (strain ATCC 29403 / PCC 7335) TaxID=91464 RepID=UPI00017EB866|nr:DUF2949 domain-containing protein [Synechococcus sp. PCC 7335]EDX86662.1 hypothetical protein S7335_4367 [Synechococcus sp. PCC 7335]